ncbi:MAG: molybdopterin-dependent oxidoreductase [Candidatus Aminicenantaceae bacterium]
MAIKRRDFLKIGGGLSLSLPLYTCISDKSYNSTSKSNWLAGVEQWVPSVCQACPGGCGILVRLIDDRAVKIEGNPLHPMNEGKVCPKGQAGLQLLYNPERVKSPLKKVGDRNEDNWQAISWDEALAAVSAKLQQLRESGQSHTVAFVGKNQKNTSDELVSRFLEVYGSPNFFKFDKWAALKNTYFVSQGIYDLMAVDLKNTRLMLSFGANFLSNWPNVMENQRIYGEKRAEGDLKIIQIEPRFSIEASRADKWIPINQGSEGLLALGIASILIKERLFNQAFVERFTSQFNEFRDFILQNIYLDQVSEMTGVPLSTIIEIAKEFHTRQPAVAVSDFNLSYSNKGLFNILAVHSLNALAGNIDSPGGFLRQRQAPLTELPPVTLDSIAKKPLSEEEHSGTSRSDLPFPSKNAKDMIDSMLNKSPYGINCLFLSSPGHQFVSFIQKKKADILESIPFIVSFSPFMDETSSLADLILPDTTFYEKWQDHHSSPLSEIPIVGISRPVIQPLYQSRPLESTLLTLAKTMGEDFAQNFPWSDYRELLLYRMKGLFRAKKGSIFSSSYEEAQLRILEERGWWTPQYDSEDAFIKDLLEKGGWQDPSYHFNERSFVYQNNAQRFVFVSSFEIEGVGSNESQENEDYPLRLFLFDLPFTSSNSSSKNMPWYQENLGFRFGLLWKIWVEVNPETAEALGIREKDIVWVESTKGRIKAVARIFPGIMPGLVGMPLNKAEQPLSAKDAPAANDPLHLLGEVYDEQTGIPDRFSTPVKIYKAKRR